MASAPPRPASPLPSAKVMREDAVDVDAEPARHALVVDRGAHLRAEARVFERRAPARAVTTSESRSGKCDRRRSSVADT